MKIYLWIFAFLFVHAHPVEGKESQVSAKELIKIIESTLSLPPNQARIQRISRVTDIFLTDPQFKDQLQTPEGKKLQNLQKRLKDFLSLSSRMDQCILNKDKSDTSLNRISVGFMGAPVPGSNACQEEKQGPISDLEKMSALLQKNLPVTRSHVSLEVPKENAKKLRDLLIEQGQKDVIKRYLDLEYRYSSQSQKPINPEHVVDVLLENPSIRMDSAKKVELVQYAQKYFESLKKHIRPVTPEDVRKTINTRIATMARARASLPPKPDLHHLVEGQGLDPETYRRYKNKGGAQAWVRDQKNEYEKKMAIWKEKNRDYDQWSNEFLSDLIATPSGRLMFTEELGKYFSETQFSPVPSAKNIERAIEESKRHLIERGHFLSEMDYERSFLTKTEISLDTLKDQLKTLVKYDSSTAGKVLALHPEYSLLVCEAINAEYLKDVQKEAAQLRGGLIAGTALALTGVGSVAGLPLIAETAYASVVPTLTAVGEIGSAAGTVLSLDQAVTLVKNNEETQEDLSRQKAFLASGEKDLESWKKIKKLEEDLKKSKWELGLQLSFLSSDLTSLGMLRSTKELGKIVTREDLLAELKVYPKLEKEFEELPLKRQNALQSMFFHLPKDLRMRALKHMKGDISLRHSKLLDLFESRICEGPHIKKCREDMLMILNGKDPIHLTHLKKAEDAANEVPNELLRVVNFSEKETLKERIATFPKAKEWTEALVQAPQEVRFAFYEEIREGRIAPEKMLEALKSHDCKEELNCLMLLKRLRDENVGSVQGTPQKIWASEERMHDILDEVKKNKGIWGPEKDEFKQLLENVSSKNSSILQQKLLTVALEGQSREVQAKILARLPELVADQDVVNKTLVKTLDDMVLNPTSSLVILRQMSKGRMMPNAEVMEKLLRPESLRFMSSREKYLKEVALGLPKTKESESVLIKIVSDYSEEGTNKVALTRLVREFPNSPETMKLLRQRDKLENRPTWEVELIRDALK